MSEPDVTALRSEPKEVHRQEWRGWQESDWATEVECPQCHARQTLWFNGGELDMKRCCGYILRLDHARIDVVIYDEYDRTPTPSKPNPEEAPSADEET